VIELAYMIREDWAQHGTAMVQQSAVIRSWVGAEPYYVAVTDVKKFNDGDRGADVEAAEHIAPGKTERIVFGIGELARFGRENQNIDHPVIALHPFEQRDLETIRRTIETASVSKLFILVWSRHDIVHTWLDGYGALNLHTRALAHTNDPLLLAAAKMIKNEDYNGLSSGHGKDVVVQLVRAFADEGYPVEPDPWLRAYFAAGGSIRHAESLERLIKEMRAGRKHRVKKHYRQDITDVLRAQLARETDVTSDPS
jgi:hypothetical protein